MASERDPVCGMTIDRDHAVGESTYGGRTFFFCSTDCLNTFKESPERYVPSEDRNDPAAFERHEAAHTSVAGVPLPKFGSAGAGGLEHEPGPETHGNAPSAEDRKR